MRSLGCRLRPWPVLVATLVPALASCSNILGSEDLCAEQQRIEICIGREQYRQGGSVSVTITNRGSSTVFEDVCSIQLDQRSSDDRFFPVYDPARGCGPDVTTDEIIARMRQLAPGAELRETIGVPTGVPQAFFRINFWFLDERGERLFPDPVSTVTFSVFPSA